MRVGWGGRWPQDAFGYSTMVYGSKKLKHAVDPVAVSHRSGIAALALAASVMYFSRMASMVRLWRDREL